jgi:N utilization substance protein A
MIVKELEGEKIDIVRHNDNIRDYIGNALSPAKVEQVIVLNEINKESIAVVSDNQLSLAIGKLGQNVRLAAKLTGWNIDIKTASEAQDLNYQDESKRIAEDLFADNDSEYHDLSELEELDQETIVLLEKGGIYSLEELVEKSKVELSKVDGISEEKADKILNIIKENIVVLGDEEVGSEEAVKEVVEKDKEEESYEYYCPGCDIKLELGMDKCPGCGIEIEF